jgi:4-hydroxythreonine-4-phosphate dehydrogenase
VPGTDGRPLLALTLGDPAGIGPEVVLAALADAELGREARMLVVGDEALLRARAERIGAAFEIASVESAEDMRARGLDSACLAGVAEAPSEDVLGRVDAEAGRASVEWVKSAAALAMAGELDGIVTAPINKQALAAAGLTCEGHTEILGEVTGAEPVMMLVGGGLRVALVTRHVALAEVPGLLSTNEIVRTARVVDEALKAYFGIESPRVAVLALNPHASDGGRFGDEEEAIIAPAVAELREAGVAADGPLVPDVAFWHALSGSHDAVVAMYHDQGLIPLKTLAFDSGVNVTLGLPVVRTSPDHGTAFDIAGKGVASPLAFAEAVRLASVMARARREGT